MEKKLAVEGKDLHNGAKASEGAGQTVCQKTVRR